MGLIRNIARTAVLAAGTIGALSGIALGLITQQARRARSVIGVPETEPLNADGVYLPDGTGPVMSLEDVLRFAVLGDSAAAGLGVDHADELPGVLLAKGIATQSQRPVLLRTYAISGSTTAGLGDQLRAALRNPPHLALIVVGANDVTARIPIGVSARLLADGMRALRDAGAEVVVGTCPDLGAIRPIAQPLRTILHTWSLALGRAQQVAVERAGGTPVPLAELFSPELHLRPGLFSSDFFHPNAAGYRAGVSVMLAPLCAVALALHARGHHVRLRPDAA